jgi:hypothetical protein
MVKFTKKKVKKHRMDEIQFSYIHKNFYRLHIMLATECGKTRGLIKESIDKKIRR